MARCRIEVTHTPLNRFSSWSSDVTITATHSLGYIMREFSKGADVVDWMWPMRKRETAVVKSGM